MKLVAFVFILTVGWIMGNPIQIKDFRNDANNDIEELLERPNTEVVIVVKTIDKAPNNKADTSADEKVADGKTSWNKEWEDRQKRHFFDDDYNIFGGGRFGKRDNLFPFKTGFDVKGLNLNRKIEDFIDPNNAEY
jgi:hypothetical protein